MKEELYKQTLFKKEKHREQMNYWMDVFTPEIQPVEFPLDFKRDIHSPRVLNSLKFSVPAELARKIFDFSKKSDLTLYVFLLAAFKVFLYRCTRNDQIIAASPLLNVGAGNDEPAEEFNPNKRIFFRDTVNTRPTFKELLLETRNKTLEAYRNQNYPLDIVFKEKGIPVEGEHAVWNSIDRVILLLENIHNKENVNDLKYDLLFSFLRNGEELRGEIYYNANLFIKESIEGFAGRYVKILDNCFHGLDTGIKDITVLSENEVEQLLEEFNRTMAEYPEDKTIHRLFEEQVLKTPDRIAVVGKMSGTGENVCHLSYRELNQRANQLAAILRERNVMPDQIIALMMYNSLEMIIGILGILKTGGAYLPVNPDFPHDRILSMLNDSNASLLLTTEGRIKNHPYIPYLHFESGNVKPFITPSRSQAEDLDSLQIPDRSLIDYEKYRSFIGQAMVKNSITIHMSRGCTFNCAFCFKIWPKKYVFRSAENIFNEINLFYKMGIRRFAFVDDLPNLNVEVSSRVFRLIIENGLKVHLHFPNGIRGDILTKEYIDLMVEAGTITMDLALETTSPRLQKLIRKNLNLKRLEENIEYITKKYPHVILEMQILHGIPTETEEEARASLDFIKNIKWVHFPYIHIMNIYPNSDMAKIAEEHGVSRKAIERSADIAYHELPETLPFSKDFTRQYQTEFLNDYFLSRERLLSVLPHQMKVLTEDELVQKYNSYLPMEIKGFNDLLELAGIIPEELEGEFLPLDYGFVPGFNQKSAAHFTSNQPGEKALKILLLDLSQYFTHDTRIMYDVVEPPLGLLYLLTHLNKTFGNRINGRIAKSRIDFDSFDDLKSLVREFKPDVIGIRSLNFYRDFFHKTVSLLRQWGVDVPILAGGPYATSNCFSVLQDKNIDLLVLGEGEITLAEVIEKILGNNGNLPDENILKTIPGIAFVEKKEQTVRQWSNREILLYDRIEEELSAAPVENPPDVNHPDDLAYIIYTSGSTGLPKGVLVRHNNLVNQVSGLMKRFDLHSSYYYILLAPFTFDVSVMHIFLPLTTGGKLHLIDDTEKKDPLMLWRFIHEKGIDILNIVPAFMKALLESIENKNIRLKYLFVGGDVFDGSLYRGLKETFNVEKIINIYGPTETTINAAMYECDNGRVEEKIPIGKPLMNYKVYILDKDSNLVPVGVPGELCVSGAGVARGYLNHPELTAEKFYRNYRSGTLYKSGDLARWLPDGNIDFLGRIDHQVKIRGYRIEPGEIEWHLARHPGVERVIVMPKEDREGEKYLCAYFISRYAQVELELKEYLSGKLPGYMIPSHFVRIKEFPVTPSGKVDAAALPDPHAGAKNAYAAPRDESEEALVKLWAEVLEVDQDKIGIDANFFELGGHSLKATILISKIHKKMDINIPMVELFRTPTIRGLSRYLKESEKEKHSSIEKAIEKEYYPLSSAQKRLYILQKMEPGAVAYNLPMTMLLEGNVERKKFEDTFLKLIARHESLRTSFQVVDDQPVQKIHDFHDVIFNVDFYSLENREKGAKEDIIRNFVRAFDLSKAPLLRVGLIKVDFENYIFMVDMHHIITDGISENILKKEFFSLYSGEELAPLPRQYKDYSEWQQRQMESGVLKQQEDYWIRKFEEEVPILRLPTDFPRPTVHSFEGSEFGFELSSGVTRELSQIGRDEGSTLFMVLLAVYYIFLSKISNEEDIVVGVPVAGRRHDDLMPIIGVFVNTLALRNSVPGGMTFREFLSSVKRQTLTDFENQDYQFEELVGKLDVARDMSRNPLFDVTFMLQNTSDRTGEMPEQKIKDLNVKPYPYEIKTSKFDLTMVAVEQDEIIKFAVEYSTSLFNDETVKRLIKYFLTVISSVIENPRQEISDITLMTVEERKQVLYEFNETETSYPGNKTIHGLFEEQVEKDGDRIAVIAPGHEEGNTNSSVLTYREVNARANCLAHLLKEKNVKSGSIIAIMVERSIEMITGIFGILKAGAAYLPIDPDYPEERKRFILAESGAKILLCKESGENELYKGIESIDLKQIGEETGNFPNQPLRDSSAPPDIAYIIYTSGTTGIPKGVMIEHGSVVNLLYGLFDKYPLVEAARLLLKTPYLFDVSVTELFGWMLGGSALVILERGGEKDPQVIIDTIAHARITHINFVPAMFNVFLDALVSSDISKLSSLEYIFLAGEALPANFIDRFNRLSTRIRLENLYGPTECTVYATGYSLSHWDGIGSIPIGKPLPNIKTYILGCRGQLQPPGVPGELCLAGTGLSRGYLNRPEQTAEKFVNSPYSLIYRTSDLARWQHDGNIEFCGRTDDQVKIRGFRVEPGEIESLLLKHSNVKEAVVMVKEDGTGDKYLCAYIAGMGTPGEISMSGELAEYLSASLPHYMIPSYFIYMDKIPLTPSGKINRKALPEIEMKAGKEYVAPRSEVEVKLVDIWSEVLGVQKSIIGIDTNFFELGGHSLKAAILATKIHKEFNIEFSLGELFKTPHIRGIAALIDLIDWADGKEPENIGEDKEIII